MAEERVVEVELDSSTVSDAVSAVVDETVKLFDSLGKALVATMEDVSNLMIIKVDADTREHLDLLVDAGVATNRGKAATQLIDEGISATETTFDRIRRTQAQIGELRQQVQSLVKTQA
jgi:hypothetical protein